MAGRLAWILAGGAAVLGGMAIQDGNFLTFGPDGPDIEGIDEAVAEARAERADRQARATIVIGPGDERSSPDDAMVRAMTAAVGRLVKAEAALAAAHVSAEEDPEALAAATVERDRARAEVDRLKAQMKASDGSEKARDAIVRQEVRSAVRSEVREAVRNN